MAEPPSARDGCALVTGASRGIGAAIARALARRRLAGRRQLPLRPRRRRGRGVARSSATAGEAVALGGDVADRGAPDELFGALETHFDAPVLVLVNNAGISRDDLTPSLGDEEWDAVLETEPDRGVPPHPPRAAADAPRPLGPDRQHLLGRRAAGEPGPGQLLRRQGRA